MPAAEALDCDVAVVGAGAAGIAAARRLHAAGKSVLLLEAGDRIGGRGWTIGMEGMALDLGCGWLHSADRNPWVSLAEEAGFTVDRGPSAWRGQYRDLGFPPEEQEAAWGAWQAFHDRIATDPPASDRAADALPPEGRWNAFSEALSGYMNGAGLGALSIADFLAYDDAASDLNWRVREGYGALIAAHLPLVQLRTATPVRRIAHGSGHVRIETPPGTVTATAAIVTVATNVLAKGAISFEPAIDDHLHAAANLPLGLAEKLFVGLREGHGLDPESHLIGDPHSAMTGSYYIMPFGRPVIEGFYGGAGAHAIDDAGKEGAFAFMIDELAALLGSGVRRHLVPLVASGWRRAEGFGGSYSHALPGQAGARAILARPASGRLLFAGEATHPTDFSTAHGAWESGLRAAGEALVLWP